MYPDDFLDQNQAILQTIEMNVAAHYRQHRHLVDFNIEKVYNGIQRLFEKEIQGKNPPRLRLKPLEQDLFDNIEGFCRVFVGETELSALYDEDSEEIDDNKAEEIIDSDVAEITIKAADTNVDDSDDEPLIDSVSKEVIVQCMKRLRGSIKTWTGNTYGKQGYLNYISNFM